MSRRFTAVFALFGFFLSPVVAFGQEKKDRPNILIVLTDDQGYGDFSCHGNPVLKTPNLDRWQAKSVRLADFHVAPMCTPTRGQLMTGRDALRNGATSVTARPVVHAARTADAAGLFARAGYHTGIFGKWHLGDNYPHRPMDRGFEEAVYHQGWGMTAAPDSSARCSTAGTSTMARKSSFQGYMHRLLVRPGDGLDEGMPHEEASRSSATCRPTPRTPPTSWPEKYSQPYKGRRPAEFFGMIANIDENIGRL